MYISRVDIMNYILRDKDELLRQWHLLKEQEQYHRDQFALALKDIHADRSIIEIELKLLESLGRVSSGNY
jgi:hypothetical protein